ncbi:hypothetical protein WOLCODRAFT_139331 [Wolfiporia cocos MD-104 SS10]|uniref:Restriction endonuclease type IV Mrr domain-containing protein n=1 Tax=Wolfiporia cocos (strain MD-104) TaxID=742152 RepID=A0A2H3JS18_WOLCO|nr:hypothetical protein WOLCODRAFT_139331 [Wolfiporia cocos MD-104 SS10]
MSLRRVGGRGDGGIDLLGWWWLPTDSNDQSSIPREDVKAAALSGQRRRIRIIAQCKDEKQSTGPKYVRELEGVLFRYLLRVQTPHLNSTIASFAKAAPVSSASVEVTKKKKTTRKKETGAAVSEGASLREDMLVSLSTSPPTEDAKPPMEGEAESPNEFDQADSGPVVGLLITSAPFTKACLLRAHSSPLPLMLLHIPPVPRPLSSAIRSAETAPSATSSKFEENSSIDADLEPEPPSALGALMFNPALGSASGLLRGRVQPRWEHPSLTTSPSASGPSPSLLGESHRAKTERPGLWYDGKRIESWTPHKAEAE